VSASPAPPQDHPRRKRSQQAGGARGSSGNGGTKRSRLGRAVPPYLAEAGSSQKPPYNAVSVPLADPAPATAAVQPHRAYNDADAHYENWAAGIGMPVPVYTASAAAAGFASIMAAVSPSEPVGSAAVVPDVWSARLQQPAQAPVSSPEQAAHPPSAAMGHAGAQQLLQPSVAVDPEPVAAAAVVQSMESPAAAPAQARALLQLQFRLACSLISPCSADTAGCSHVSSFQSCCMLALRRRRREAARKPHGSRGRRQRAKLRPQQTAAVAARLPMRTMQQQAQGRPRTCCAAPACPCLWKSARSPWDPQNRHHMIFTAEARALRLWLRWEAALPACGWQDKA
jgi:hypothetical protein